jgi:hypothetical protein
MTIERIGIVDRRCDLRESFSRIDIPYARAGGWVLVICLVIQFRQSEIATSSHMLKKEEENIRAS